MAAVRTTIGFEGRPSRRCSTSKKLEHLQNMAAGTNIHLSTTLDGPQKQKATPPFGTVIDPAHGRGIFLLDGRASASSQPWNSSRLLGILEGSERC